ncbi:UrcA family protein [Novosphingobium sp. PY1]|uniref:UrcA family protein n=1 Tax=Novosphingobium sp. PY1 TaxID=1882221 RepID=UPI001A8EE936|nr:UrcA family protein [Novosphingobium sp. PY1]GFM30685.1 uncharacterized protein PY1_contig-12-46 [Novosphingobium sp. PY1]
MTRLLATGFIAAAVASALPASNALAQETSQDAVQNRAAITVVAPRARQTDRTYTGVPIETLTAQAVVYVDDLNLSTAAGKAKLDDRVAAAAKTACAWLDEVYPLATPIGPDDCERDAIKRAKSQVDAAVAGNAM